MFTGTLRLKVCEATGLRPTDFQTRHTMTFGRLGDQLIDPYVSIDVDEKFIGKCFWAGSPVGCVLMFSASQPKSLL